MDHFLLLLVVVAIVHVLRIVLLIQLGLCFHTIIWLLRIHLSLHVGEMRLVPVGLLLSRGYRALQILTHAYHSSVIPSW